jgi:hypothetical protein
MLGISFSIFSINFHIFFHQTSNFINKKCGGRGLLNSFFHTTSKSVHAMHINSFFGRVRKNEAK